MTNENGSGAKAFDQGDGGMGCPIDPSHRPEDCRVIELRLQKVESKVSKVEMLLNFLVDETIYVAALQGRKLKDPRKR